MTPSLHDKKLSRLGKAIVALTCAVPIAATLAYGAVDPWTIGLLAILVAVIVILWMSDAALIGELRYDTTKLQLPILALLALGCIQLLPLGSGIDPSSVDAPLVRSLSLDPYATRFFLMRLSICFVYFAAALAYVPGGSRPQRIAGVIVIFGTLIAFVGILQKLATPEAIYGLRTSAQAIAFGPFVNQHHFAALMEMTSGVALGMLFGRGIHRDRKPFLAIGAGIMGMAIVFTGSRGGLISYLAVIGFVVAASVARGADVSARNDSDARSRGRRNLLLLTGAGALIFLVLGSVLILGGEAALRRSFGFGDPGAGDVTSGRSHFWGIAWKIFLANPILGAGLDAFGVAFPKYDTWNGQFRVEQAHNDYLQTLADGGILGFACVAAFVVLFLRKGISAVTRGSDVHRSVAAGALAGCFGVLIHSFFDFPLRTPANAFVFLLLVVLVTGTASPKRSRKIIAQ